MNLFNYYFNHKANKKHCTFTEDKCLKTLFCFKVFPLNFSLNSLLSLSSSVHRTGNHVQKLQLCLTMKDEIYQGFKATEKRCTHMMTDIMAEEEVSWLYLACAFSAWRLYSTFSQTTQEKKRLLKMAWNLTIFNNLECFSLWLFH